MDSIGKSCHKKKSLVYMTNGQHLKNYLQKGVLTRRMNYGWVSYKCGKKRYQEYGHRLAFMRGTDWHS